MMFWILSSILCQLHLEELQAAQKTKQCNNSKNTFHLRASKGLCTHSMKVRGGFFQCSTAFLPSCLAFLQQGVTEIIIHSAYVKHSVPEFIISRARKRIKKSRKDVKCAHIGSSSLPPFIYVDKEHYTYRQKYRNAQDYLTLCCEYVQFWFVVQLKCSWLEIPTVTTVWAPVIPSSIKLLTAEINYSISFSWKIIKRLPHSIQVANLHWEANARW